MQFSRQGKKCLPSCERTKVGKLSFVMGAMDNVGLRNTATHVPSACPHSHSHPLFKLKLSHEHLYHAFEYVE